MIGDIFWILKGALTLKALGGFDEILTVVLFLSEAGHTHTEHCILIFSRYM